MKAHRETPKPEFIPVTLTLESQEEVDGMYVILGNAAICNAVGLPVDSYHQLNALIGVKNTNTLYDVLNRILK